VVEGSCLPKFSIHLHIGFFARSEPTRRFFSTTLFGHFAFWAVKHGFLKKFWMKNSFSLILTKFRLPFIYKISIYFIEFGCLQFPVYFQHCPKETINLPAICPTRLFNDGEMTFHYVHAALLRPILGG
jgi:hypothetical protein